MNLVSFAKIQEAQSLLLGHGVVDSCKHRNYASLEAKSHLLVACFTFATPIPHTCTSSSYRHNINGKVFLVVKFVKIDIRNHIGYEFMNDRVICFVERESVNAILSDYVIVCFQNINARTCRVKFEVITIVKSLFYLII
jgi:hypothetical protein